MRVDAEHARFVEQFGASVDSGAAAVCVGAGLSLAAGYPSWSEMSSPLADELGSVEVADLPQLAQYYVDNISGGRARLDGLLLEKLRAVASAGPQPAHQALASMPVEDVWTTNYDTILEEAFTAHPRGVVVIDEDEQLATALPAGRRLYKMHGSLGQDAPRIVLTRDDFDRYPSTHPRFWALLQAQFLTTTFLFVGLSFDDPNLTHVFRLVRLLTPRITREHFAIMRRPSDAAERRMFQLRTGELQRVGIGVVPVRGYDALPDLLGSIVARCRPLRLLISGSTPGPRSAPTGSAYPTTAMTERLNEIAVRLGQLLAEVPVEVVAGGQVGAAVGYEMCRQLQQRDLYRPERFTLVRRMQDEPLTEPNLRIGMVVFSGENPMDLRSDALARVRTLLVLGGETGAAQEVQRAREARLGVVPLACTGGTARRVWDEMGADFDGLLLGGRSVNRSDFDLLASDDVHAAASAAVRLVRQALFLPPS